MHTIYPSPYAPAVDLRSEQIRAMFLASPWLAMFVEAEAEEEEQTGGLLAEGQNDYLTRDRIMQFKKMFKPELNEVWGNPYEAEVSITLWKKLFPGGGFRRHGEHRAICRKALLAVESSEVLFDSCVNFGRDFLGCESVRVDTDADLDFVWEGDFVLVVAPGEAHVQPGLDRAVRYYDGRMMKAILAFLETC